MPVHADLDIAETGYAGRIYPTRGKLHGHSGTWYLVRRGRHHHRVVRVGADGKSEDTSYRVLANAFQRDQTAEHTPYRVVADAFQRDQPATDAAPIPTCSDANITTVGERGAIYLPAHLRQRLQIEEGSIVMLVEHQGGIWIRPAVIVPRDQVATNGVNGTQACEVNGHDAFAGNQRLAR